MCRALSFPHGTSRVRYSAPNMLDALRPLLMFVPVFALFGLVWLIAWRLGLLKSSPHARSGESLPYRTRASLMSDGEKAFLSVLNAAVRMVEGPDPSAPGAGASSGPVLAIFPSVRLAEVIEVTLSRSADRSRWQTAQNRIDRKQLDFVLCDAGTTRPRLVIEYDDRTHGRSDRRSRDEFLDNACAAAGLPILHITAARTHDPRIIADQIRHHLAPSSSVRRTGRE